MGSLRELQSDGDQGQGSLAAPSRVCYKVEVGATAGAVSSVPCKQLLRMAGLGSLIACGLSEHDGLWLPQKVSQKQEVEAASV